ncbi:MAG: hypothetical protein PHU25_06905 [Deltaproteobacteria bacterium]|nr:hypothetical protein [Deltaproteobacteria bacterium]
MDSDSSFLVARVRVDALIEDDLEWITSTESPYQPVDPIDFDEEELEAIYNLYVKTYGKIDNRLNIKDKYGLFEYNRWLLVLDANDNLLGFVLLKTTAFGLKIGLASSDQSAEGRKAVREFHEKAFFVEGIYAEVSDALERIVIKKSVPRVLASDAEKILAEKALDIDADGYHYSRLITGVGDRKKMMVGRPVV